MSSLIFEEQIKLLSPNERICLRCHKIFKRKPGITNRVWNLAHRMCSTDCHGAMTDHKNSERLPWGQNLFNCNVCGSVIIGNKKQLKKHKNEAALILTNTSATYGNQFYHKYNRCTHCSEKYDKTILRCPELWL